MSRHIIRDAADPADRSRSRSRRSSLAGWYRAWAELAANGDEKALRLEFAIGLEKRARALLKPD